MKFSLNFVKEFLEVKSSPQELASLLTMAGMEVEGLEQVGKDWIFDIEITTNRYDWLSIVGIAREISAILGRSLKIQYPKAGKEIFFREKTVTREAERDCSYYIAKIIKGVKIGVSPQWLKECLLHCGINPVNDVVDITNYFMLKWGNPLHAFDLDKIEGNICVRRARKNENFIGIDNKERILGKDNLVIADDKKVIALAGVIGAKNTEVDSATKNIFLEAAIFSPLSVRHSRRLAGINTESSYRFERMVSALNLEYASFESARLIGEMTKGVFGGSLISGEKPLNKKNKIILDLNKLKEYLGISIPKPKVRVILKNLGFKVENLNADKLSVYSSDYRFDIKREVDLYEEIARIYGYDKIPTEIPFLKCYSRDGKSLRMGQEKYKFKNKLKVYLALLGLREVITYSLQESKVSPSVSEAEVVCIVNPLRQQENSLRTDLLAGMLGVVRRNLDRRNDSLYFFEIADVYSKKEKGFCESPVLALATSGKLSNFFYLKKVVEDIFNYLNISNFNFKEEKLKNFSNSLSINSFGICFGFLGKFNNISAQSFGLGEDIFYVQLDLEKLVDNEKQAKYKTFSSYPAVYRDISISLLKSNKFEEIREIIGQGSEYLRNIEIINVYKAETVSENNTIFTLRIFYQSKDRTLTSKEVDYSHNDIREKLSQQQGIFLR